MRKEERLSRDVEAQLEKFRRAAEERAASDPSHPSRHEPPPPPVQLPIWPEPVRGSPNSFLRSALFAAIHSKKRQELQGDRPSPEKPPGGVTIAAQSGYSIEYAGTQLNQYDLDVWLQAVHLARQQPLGAECCFTGNAFLKAIGRANGKREYEDLDESLDRLWRGRLVIRWATSRRRYVFKGGLISHYVREETSRAYKVSFAQEVINLFAPACWTQLEWEERLALKGKPLALWLHSYYSSHAEPRPITAAFVHAKCGSPTQLLKHFRADLKAAFRHLERATSIRAELDGDRIVVTRVPTPAQARHIIRRRKRRKEQDRASARDRLAGQHEAAVAMDLFGKP